MTNMTRQLLAVAVALALSDAGLAQEVSPKPPLGATPSQAALVDAVVAQDPLPAPLTGGTDSAVGGGVLEALPQPRDLPASLFAPPPPSPPNFFRIDAPYLVPDRLLDPPGLPSPGWFAGAEIQVIKPHLISGLSEAVANRAQKAKMTSTTVALPTTPLDWTVSPRVFLGYRLPSGYGEFLVSYRHLGTSGNGSLSGAKGDTALRSRLAFDMIDFDYNSREISLGPQWDMRWTFGVRALFLFFDSRFNQPTSLAAAGDGFAQVRDYNNLAGVGPHGALELARHLGQSGWSLYLRGDIASVFDGSHVGFLTRSTTPGPDGRTLVGETRHFGTQDAPILNLRAGLNWQRSRTSPVKFFLGYQYERFWALDRLPPVGNNPPSVGQLWDQGIVLQTTINY
jgi:hypothetical protein